MRSAATTRTRAVLSSHPESSDVRSVRGRLGDLWNTPILAAELSLRRRFARAEHKWPGFALQLEAAGSIRYSSSHMLVPTRGTVVAGKYELIEEIGRGGMGVVFRAYAKSLGLHCALKMVLPGRSAELERRRLLREARIAGKLRSPYIVNTYDVGEWEGCAFIAMELLEGEPLSKLLKQSERLTPAFTVELMRQLGLGLDKAHAAGLVHRDLKPDNIFVVEREPLLVKLLDFGIAKQLRVDAADSAHVPSVAGAIVGTPHYMSPEQVSASNQLDFRSDLWALAVIAFECLTGQVPFEGETWPQLLLNICMAPIPVPSQRHGALPPGFDAFWLAAAARDPAQRPASARAFVDQLRQALSAQPAPSSEPSGRHARGASSISTSPARARGPGLLAAAGLACAAVGGVATYATTVRLAPATLDALETTPGRSGAVSLAQVAPVPLHLALPAATAQTSVARLPLDAGAPVTPFGDPVARGDGTPRGAAARAASVESTRSATPERIGSLPVRRTTTKPAAPERAASHVVDAVDEELGF